MAIDAYRSATPAAIVSISAGQFHLRCKLSQVSQRAGRRQILKLRTAVLLTLLLTSCSSGTSSPAATTPDTELLAGAVGITSNCRFETDVTNTEEDERFCLDSAAARIDTGPVASISSVAGDGVSSQMFVARTTDIVVEGEGVTDVMIDGNVMLILLPFPEITNGIPVDFVLDGVRYRCELSNQFRPRMAEICTVL